MPTRQRYGPATYREQRVACEDALLLQGVELIAPRAHLRGNAALAPLAADHKADGIYTAFLKGRA